MRKAAHVLTLLALAALAACGEQNTLAPQPDLAFNNSGDHGDWSVTAMTRNMYVGADVDAVIAALGTGDPNTIGAALQEALQTLQHTDFAARVEAMADEIARNRPDVVGLQEVYELTILPVGPLAGILSAPIQMNFLPALQRALAREHVDYVVAARNTSTDATLLGGAVHLVDHDVLLVNPHRVKLTGAPVATVYTYNVFDGFGLGFDLLRGYVAREAKIDGVPLLLVNTHLESDAGPMSFADLRAAQASELVAFIGAAPRVLLTGDFNDIPGSDMYAVLAGASLVDTWGALRPRAPGFSCCQAPDLSNRQSILNQRIDFIWTRGFTRRSGKLEGDIDLVSAKPSDRVRGAFGWIWPSDHAGVVAELDAPQPEIRH